MRSALVVALVVVVLLTGIPVAFGMMAMESCPNCPAPDASAACGLCFATVAWAMPAIVLGASRVVSLRAIMRSLLLATLLERPPRLV